MCLHIGFMHAKRLAMMAVLHLAAQNTMPYDVCADLFIAGIKPH